MSGEFGPVDAVLAIDGNAADGVEGLPRHPLRVGRPGLVTLGVAAFGALLLDDRPIGPCQPGRDFFQLRIRLDLNAEMVDAQRTAAAFGNREIDPGVVQHPFCIVGFPDIGIDAEQRAVESDRLCQALYRNMHMQSFHGVRSL